MKRILSNILHVEEDEINDDSSMNTLKNWDSQKHIEIVVSIEEEFEIPQLSMDEIVEMTSVVEIRRILKSKKIDF